MIRPVMMIISFEQVVVKSGLTMYYQNIEEVVNVYERKINSLQSA